MSRLLAQIQRAQLNREHARLVNRALTETEHLQTRQVTVDRLDPLRLRGIPVIGRGHAGGHITGTRPDKDCMKRLTRRD